MRILELKDYGWLKHLTNDLALDVQILTQKYKKYEKSRQQVSHKTQQLC
jgi:hypothetical protein